MPHEPANRYDALSRSIHWMAAGLIVLAWALIEVHDAFPKGSDGRKLIGTLHMQLGLAVLVLLAVRLPWRALHPVAPAAGPPWTVRLAFWTKLALYALMLAAPIVGVATAQARGEAVTFLGLALPDLFGQFNPQRRTIKEVHETLGNAILVLAALHAAAALWHHFVLHDGTLQRMLGTRRGTAPPVQR